MNLYQREIINPKEKGYSLRQKGMQTQKENIHHRASTNFKSSKLRKSRLLPKVVFSFLEVAKNQISQK